MAPSARDHGYDGPTTNHLLLALPPSLLLLRLPPTSGAPLVEKVEDGEGHAGEDAESRNLLGVEERVDVRENAEQPDHVVRRDQDR